MLNSLNDKNNYRIYSVTDKEFETFGRIIKNIDEKEILAVAKKIELPKEGSVYVASEPTFEALQIKQEIEDNIFGTLPMQMGYCYGHSNFLNAAEWHTSSEINIAVTDLLIIVGHVWDVKDNAIDTSKFKAFFVPQGTVLECYATTLHYGPCQTNDDGFGWVVVLPEGTNTELSGVYDDKLLWAKNKWLISHVDTAELVNAGAVAGVTGTNFEIKY